MKKKMMLEEDVKKALNITDFRSLSKEKIMEFVSIIPKVDKEVAISIINQFPNYADMAKDMVSGMIKLCDNALQDAKVGRKDVIESYRVVLETLKEELNKGDLSIDDRKRITDDMLVVAEKIDAVNDKHLEFLKDTLKKVGGTIAGVVVVGVAILGAIDSNKNK
ncbi:MAG: hypothetical protein IKA31_03745 [Clostridia bacterium]|nr:hypothetical protein [Clostridia bacterium]